MSLPDAILEPILVAGEEVLASLLTAGTRAWVVPDGAEVAAPLWAIATERRLWLLAAADGQLWCAAEPDVAAVRLDKGWTRDALIAGPWAIPLRRGTRAAAEALIARLRDAPGGGERLPPAPDPLPVERAPVARGAVGVPEWLAQAVPASPEERWLHAVETGSTQPFNLPDGTVARAVVHIAHTDARAVLAARVEGRPPWLQVLEVPLLREARPGRDRLLAGERVLWGPLLSDRPSEVAALLSAARTPRARWSAAARCALEDGRARDAVRLLAEAHDLGHDAGWDVLGRLLLAVDLPPLAVAAAVRELQADPSLDVDTAIGRWSSGDARAVRRDDVDASFVRGLMREAVGGLQVPAPPLGLPWPPRKPAGVWAAALAVAGRVDEALALWAARSTTPRQRQAIAALRTAAGAPGAAASWDEAAAALRQAGDPGAADALDRALALDPTASRLWRRAAWAFADGDLPTARSHWSAAVVVDPEGADGVPLPPEAERLVGDVASGDEEWAAAAAAYQRAVAKAPHDPATLRALADVLQGPLARPAEAADVVHALVGSGETAWQVLREEAVLRLRAGDREGAATALREAVAADFLHPEAYDAAIALAPEAGIDPRWWAHLRGLLVAGDVREGRPAVPNLSGIELERLHPGGVGMMERLRHSLTSVEPPDRRALVRGLARLEADHPDAAAVVSRLSEALGLAAPDVFLFRGDGAWGASAWATTPPVLLVGADHLRPGPRALTPSGLAFLVAVELVHLKCDHPVLSFDTDLVGTSRSVYTTFGRYAGTAESVVDVVTLIPGVDQLAKLQTLFTLSRRVFATRSAIDKVGSAASPVLGWLGVDLESEPGSVGRQGLEGAALAFRMQADRAALLLTGDLAAAVRAILLASSSSLAVAERVAREGLAAVLADPRPPAESLRLAALVQFAAGLDIGGPSQEE